MQSAIQQPNKIKELNTSLQALTTSASDKITETKGSAANGVAVFLRDAESIQKDLQELHANLTNPDVGIRNALNPEKFKKIIEKFSKLEKTRQALINKFATLSFEPEKFALSGINDDIKKIAKQAQLDELAQLYKITQRVVEQNDKSYRDIVPAATQQIDMAFAEVASAKDYNFKLAAELIALVKQRVAIIRGQREAASTSDPSAPLLLPVPSAPEQAPEQKQEDPLLIKKMDGLLSTYLPQIRYFIINTPSNIEGHAASHQQSILEIDTIQDDMPGLALTEQNIMRLKIKLDTLQEKKIDLDRHSEALAYCKNKLDERLLETKQILDETDKAKLSAEGVAKLAELARIYPNLKLDFDNLIAKDSYTQTIKYKEEREKLCKTMEELIKDFEKPLMPPAVPRLQIAEAKSAEKNSWEINYYEDTFELSTKLREMRLFLTSAAQTTFEISEAEIEKFDRKNDEVKAELSKKDKADISRAKDLLTDLAHENETLKAQIKSLPELKGLDQKLQEIIKKVDEIRADKSNCDQFVLDDLKKLEETHQDMTNRLKYVETIYQKVRANNKRRNEIYRQYYSEVMQPKQKSESTGPFAAITRLIPPPAKGSKKDNTALLRATR